MPAGQVDAMQAAGPAPHTFEPRNKPLMDFVRTMLVREDLSRISVEEGRLQARARGLSGVSALASAKEALAGATLRPLQGSFDKDGAMTDSTAP